MGMAGGLLLPTGLKRPMIRAEGIRRGHAGDGLDDFVDIVKALDVHFVSGIRKKMYGDFAASLKANQKRR